LWVTTFKLVQFIVIGVFVVFISDFRKKHDMTPLVNEKITKFLKHTYFVPVAICVYTMATMNYLTVFDYVSLMLTTLGASVVVKSKLDLGICHTWAGYCKKNSKLEVSGIYAYIRHPLYLGIHLFSFGELAMLMFHAPWFLTATAFVLGLFMVMFLTFSATKETKHLTKCLGEYFLKYKESVHPFLPLKIFINKNNARLLCVPYPC
jgi:protein-S-isoprenylcysteine O-methyltransferase Ste14